jgi:hypothetical protein
MRKIILLFQKLSLFFLVFFIMVGCMPLKSSTATNVYLSAFTPGNIPSDTKPVSTNFIYNQRSNLTPSFKPTFTNVITMIPELTPLPTLSEIQAGNRLMEWLEGSLGCRLPCWGEITPGVTNWQETEQILSSTVKIEKIEENGPCTIGQCNEVQWASRANFDIHGSVVSRSNGTIYAIFIEGSPPPSVMRLDRILTIYGKPDKVYIQAYKYINPDIYFGLTLSYPNHQFIIQFGWNAYLSNTFITACIQDKSINLDILPVEEEWTDDFVRQTMTGDKTAPEFFKPLDMATNMTIDQFYEMFKNVKGEACINTPEKYWP